MALTPKGLWYPAGTDIINPLHPVLAAMQTSVGDNPRLDTPTGIHTIANAAGRATLANNLVAAGYTPSASNPIYAHQVDTGLLYVYNGSSWQEQFTVKSMNGLDLNAVKDSGVYSGYTYVNGPSGGTNLATLLVLRYSNDWVIQIYFLQQSGGLGVFSGIYSRNFYSGTTWSPWENWSGVSAWASYNPSFAGLTVGNGTVVARWIENRKTVTADVHVTLGSTSSVTGEITVTLPKTGSRNQGIGYGWAAPTGISGSAYPLTAFRTANPNLVIVRCLNMTSGTLQALSSSFPATWTTGGQFYFQTTYQVN